MSAPSISTSAQLQKRWEAGPLLNGANFPDPSLLLVNGRWVSFATRTIGGPGSPVHIQIAESSDFVIWSLVANSDGSQRDALPILPPWVDALAPNTWAPDVSVLDDGTFIMYFSASTAQDRGKHCVGAAFADDILGPYTPQNEPMFCPLAQGGAIDPAGFRDDDGSRYVVYKIDGNAIGHGGPCGNSVPPYVPTPLILQPVASDGVTLAGEPLVLLDNQGAADEGVLEAPSLALIGGTYFLFFSSGCFTAGFYTVSYATASSITGPYTRAPNPLFQTGDNGLVAPGGASISSDGAHLVFHADFESGRALYEAVLGSNGSVVGA